jgi:hypothetical protein
MSIFAADPLTTVQQKSPWCLTKALGLVVFLAMSVAVYGWKYHRLPPPATSIAGQALAKVVIHQPTFDGQPAWHEVLKQSQLEIRDHLKIVSQRSVDATTVAISLDGLPQEFISPQLNMIASAYVQACRLQWRANVEQACSTAHEAMRTAQSKAEAANMRLELLQQRRSEARAAVHDQVETAADSVENPKWTDATRRLAELEERRRVLLFERTPLHPSVQEIEMHIGDMRREMAAIPPRIAQLPSSESSRPLTPLPSGPTIAELDAAQRDASALCAQLPQFESAEKSALAMRSQELRIDLEPAEAISPLPASPRFAWSLVGTTLITAATSVIGLGMISFGASLEPALSSVAELQSVLPAPVLGVVPAAYPVRSNVRSAFRRRVVRAFAIVSGMVLLALVMWLAFTN